MGAPCVRNGATTCPGTPGSPGETYCVIWIAADAGGGGPVYTDAGVIRSGCVPVEVEPTAACDGAPLRYVAYDTYDNYVSWVECVQP